MGARPRLVRHGAPPDWPHAERSEQVAAGGLRWHVQRWPLPRPGASWLLLLHGTGASAHSFAALAPLLARDHGLVVPDLPGHAFTSRPRAAGLSLPGMAAGLGALLQVLGVAPSAVVGHSAGAAIGARMVLDGHARPARLVSLNGAWFPPGGTGGWWYAPMARLLAINPLAPALFSWHAARPATLERLLRGTGSRLDAAARARYARLAGDVDHVGAVIAMMAAWDLASLPRELPRLAALGTALHLVAAERDAAVPPQQAQALAAQVPGATVHRLPGLGHLAHEEAPREVAAVIEPLLAD
ncbi:MAG: alpha/beta fold hydrolase [Burkholderiaceae bacterium]|jgi:magnesium chelatase accessory protein|nr:alpha/beta fold hydrolase [Burkholderiaceae bacterium]MCZ8174525.1 alpha/beta fold hydrolase [Burkholderiaceae bacterium]